MQADIERHRFVNAAPLSAPTRRQAPDSRDAKSTTADYLIFAASHSMTNVDKAPRHTGGTPIQFGTAVSRKPDNTAGA